MSTIIQWNSSSTDDVCYGNRRLHNSRHTEVCHLQFHRDMFCATHGAYTSLPTTLPAVLADSLLHCFLLCVGREHEHVQQYVSEFVQSCDDSKQMLQGKKHQKFYVRGNFIQIYVFLLYNTYCLFLYIPCEIILFNFAHSSHNLLITEQNWRGVRITWVNLTDTEVIRMCEEMSLTKDSDTWQLFVLRRLKIINRNLFNCCSWLVIVARGNIKK